MLPKVPAAGRPKALFGDSNALGLGLALAFGGDAPVLAFTPVAEIVELALQATAVIAIVFIVDSLLEVLLALGFPRVRDGDRRAGIVAKGAESAARELDLDEILLYFHQRDGRRIAGAECDAIALQPVAVFLVIERLAGVALHVDAVGRAGHIDTERHTLSLERTPQRIFGLGRRRRGQRQHGDRPCTHWLQHRRLSVLLRFTIGSTARLRHEDQRRRGRAPATTSAIVAAALSQALATDAARART